MKMIPIDIHYRAFLCQSMVDLFDFVGIQLRSVAPTYTNQLDNPSNKASHENTIVRLGFPLNRASICITDSKSNDVRHD